MSTTFSLLHEKVQKYIYREKWTHFRPIQDQAIEILCKTDSHLLICAPTASGKTEAAFLPIVSRIADNHSSSFRAIYISPLKALINDQFRRIGQMCDQIGVPVSRWHGDVGQNKKTAALKNPGGILLITPESLEALLMRKQSLARQALSLLQWVVIDEIHSFAGAERGAQLRSLLARIEHLNGRRLTRLGLSATIGNPDEVAEWMIESGTCKIIQDNDWNDSGVQGLVRGFKLDIAGAEEPETEIHPTSNGLVSTLCDSFRSGKNLIFGNSKRHLEEISLKTSSLSEDRNWGTQFLIHHGSLSKEIRENAETSIKESTKDVSIFCTSTLEMGIDIGAIEKVGFIDPPWSVSGFSQRTGRSGRRPGTDKKFEFFIEHFAITSESHAAEMLREDLVKSIAIVLLYLEDFKEPLQTKKKHFSTLVHQITAFSTQQAGASLEDLKKVILKSGFRNVVSDSQFLSLLDHCISSGLLYQDTSGVYVPGKIGEKLVEHYEFYSVFMSSEQWTVVCDGSDIGTIPIIHLYKPGDRILLGSRLWLIDAVNESAKRLIVKPAKRANAPIFESTFGVTHQRIHQKMLEIYRSLDIYAFLDEQGIQLLSEGRVQFQSLMAQTGSTRLSFPIFEGTLIQNTIKLGLTHLGADFGLTECFLQFSKLNESWKFSLLSLLKANQDPGAFVRLFRDSVKIIEKYDRFLPNQFLNEGYAEAYIDIAGAIKWLGTID